MTLHDEIRFIWLRPKIAGSWMFLLNRYIAFFSVSILLRLNLHIVTQNDPQTLTWLPGFFNWTSEKVSFFPSLHRN